MPINLIEYGVKTSGLLDKKFVQDSVTGFLEANSSDVKFVDAKTVMISNVEMSGLADYDRSNGFVRGSIVEEKTPYTLTMDRGRSFLLDREDAREALMDGSARMAEFQRTKVAPEVDAYALSKLHYLAGANNNTESATTATTSILTSLIGYINDVYTITGYGEELVCFINSVEYGKLMASSELTKQINVMEFKKGDVKTTVKAINDVALIPVPINRMYSEYKFLTGTDAGQENGGFAPTSTANTVKFTILPKKAASLVTKTNKVRVFSPDVLQESDAWKFDYRRYFDLICTKEKAKAIVSVY